MKNGCFFCPVTQKTDWHFLRETAPFPNWLVHCEWGELPSSTGASRMSLICTTTSRERGSVTDSYRTFIFETWEMQCLKLLYFCSYPFLSQPWTCCLGPACIWWVFLYEAALWSKFKAPGTCCLHANTNCRGCVFSWVTGTLKIHTASTSLSYMYFAI